MSRTARNSDLGTLGFGINRWGIVSVIGLPEMEAVLEALREEHCESAWGESGMSSPNPSSCSDGSIVGTEIIFSFLACLRLVRDFAVDVLFSAPGCTSASTSRPLNLRGTMTLSRFVKRFLAAIPIPAMPKPEFDLGNPGTTFGA